MTSGERSPRIRVDLKLDTISDCGCGLLPVREDAVVRVCLHVHNMTCYPAVIALRLSSG